MQFPNCDAKVSVFSVYANEMEKKGMFYNIVLYFRANIYTCKHFEGLESKKTSHRNSVEGLRWLFPLNTFKQNDILCTI